MAGRSATSVLKALLDGAEIRCAKALLKKSATCGRDIRHLNSCGILATQSTNLPHLIPGSLYCQPARSFLNIAIPLTGSKRLEYSEARVLGYSVEQMYNVVANVENYQLFVPWCKRSRVISKAKGITRTELEVGFPPILERYVSDVSVIPLHQVKAVCTDSSLFSHLETVWRFGPGVAGQPQSCTLDFYVSFEFKSILHSQLATMFLDEVVKQMVVAFEKRALKIYGPQCAIQKNRKLCEVCNI
ncbi:coenzyme Q-binding protein COQ10 homolog B, mitochondrial-like [Latimeria chalumnae]|uniref:Si:ch73-141c7.1 n=1 Tax=Latimeria chalumnae TaxID=7897 RepID=H3AG90_LATCH|nr:PREDICTED: coenzyme Q-binding protein COQ10 homolog B, mitochondrial-like [Latimeria chalumnae]|eukprot:XP_005994083.1 PREDICTED: coenzyme Q-binding protein COQ10 homolog B, mitochondrial-like [Latimeria chalumnae]